MTAMTDDTLIKRLRIPHPSAPTEGLLQDAANRIEQLQAENAKLWKFVEDTYCDCEEEDDEELPTYVCERCKLLRELKGGE